MKNLDRVENSRVQKLYITYKWTGIEIPGKQNEILHLNECTLPLLNEEPR